MAQHDPQELVVDQTLVDELERRGVHGMHVGDRVRVQLIRGDAAATFDDLPPYFASFASGKPDLAQRIDDILTG